MENKYVGMWVQVVMHTQTLIWYVSVKADLSTQPGAADIASHYRPPETHSHCNLICS